MSSETPRQPPDDRELEDFLAGRHPVGKAYRDASETEFAPRELDDSILAMARESIRSAPPARRRPRWVQPMAVAATLGLSLSVLMNLWRDPDTRGQMAPTATRDADLQRLEQGAAESLPAQASVIAEAPAEVVAPQAQSSAAAPSEDARAQNEESRDRTAQAREQQQAGRQEMKKKERSVDPESVPSDGPAPDRPSASMQAPPVPQPFPQPAQAPKSAAESRAFSAQDRVEESDDAAPAPDATAERASPRVFPAPPPPPAPIRAEPAPASAAVAPEAEAATDAAIRQSLGAAAKSEAPRMRRGDAAGAMAPPAAKSAPVPVSLEEWISGMRAALRDGDREKARELLAGFRRDHPDHLLPEDLSAFEKSAP